MADESKLDLGTSATVSQRLSITSTSSTNANNVDNHRFLRQDDDILENLQTLDISSATVTVNRNTLSLDTRDSSRAHDESTQQTFRKLTPVHHHPLMMMNDSFDDEDTLKNSNAPARSFPDVVPSFAHPHASSKMTLGTADLVNSTVNNNNNDVKQIRAAVKPFYREPSPVSCIKYQ